VIDRAVVLAFPDWVPRRVAQEAEALHKEAAGLWSRDEIEVLNRLATDPRMKVAWDELRKRRRQAHRPTGKFFYSVPSPGPVSSERAADLHAAALAILFKFVVLRARLNIGSLPQLEAARRPYSEQAALLRQDAETLAAEGDRAAAKRLVKAAEVYERRGDKFFLFGHGQTAEVGFAVSIAKLMSDLFRSPMYGTVATLASVAFDRQIQRDAVREWCRGVWGKRLNIAG
jgi:hypothetical protein